MKIREITVVCAALAAGATLSANSNATSNQVLVASPDGQRVPTLSARPVEGRVVTGAPYSAEITSESVQMLADGNRIVHRSTGRVYRDRDGRTRREDDRPNGTASVSITDPVAGKAWTLDTAAKTARETPVLGMVTSDFFTPFRLGEIEGRVGGAAMSARGQGTANPPTLPGGVIARGGGASAVAGAGGRGGGAVGATGGVARGGGAAGAAGAVFSSGGRGGRGGGDVSARVEEQLPSRSIEGVVCSGVRRTTTIPAGMIGNEQPIKIVSEEWTSMDLQVLVQTDLNDPRTGHSTYQLTHINRADPDPGLFKVPSDFTVVAGGGRGGRGGK